MQPITLPGGQTLCITLLYLRIGEPFPAAKGKSVKVKASALIEAVQNEGERLFTDSPFQGA